MFGTNIYIFPCLSVFYRFKITTSGGERVCVWSSSLLAVMLYCPGCSSCHWIGVEHFSPLCQELVSSSTRWKEIITCCHPAHACVRGGASFLRKRKIYLKAGGDVSFLDQSSIAVRAVTYRLCDVPRSY